LLFRVLTFQLNLKTFVIKLKEISAILRKKFIILYAHVQGFQIDNRQIIPDPRHFKENLRRRVQPTDFDSMDRITPKAPGQMRRLDLKLTLINQTKA